jgi:hypothetical protein
MESTQRSQTWIATPREDLFLETAESLSSFVVPALMGMKVDWVIGKSGIGRCAAVTGAEISDSRYS